jgi:hypothetical protein
MSLSRERAGLLLAASLFAGCSDTSKAVVTDAGTDAGVPVTDAAGDVAEDSGPPGPFTGDCSSSRWASVSDTCWSCFCKTCKETLNACNLDCVAGIACASANHTQVGVAADVPCEERAFQATCRTTPDAQAVVGQLVGFDECLIAAHKPPEQLRACEAECGIVYTGDVCQRFPAPEAGSDASADGG